MLRPPRFGKAPSDYRGGMRTTPRPSEVFGRPGVPTPVPSGAERPADRPARRRPRWPAIAGLAVLAVVGIALLAAPSQVGEGGVPPAVVDVVSEDQAIAALALYRAQAEAQEALAVGRSLYAPPGPSVVRVAADDAAAVLDQRLAAARAIGDADPAVRAYWSDPAHDDLRARLKGAAVAIAEVNLLVAVHDTIYDGAGSIPLESAQFELTSRYLTGQAPATPMADWGRALLDELDGADARGAAEEARARTDAWWAEQAGQLSPVATEALRAYLGGLPESTLRGLEGHPLAGPGLTRLRAG
jgi:hypothetical protein